VRLPSPSPTAAAPNQKTPLMRRITTIREIRRPTPENRAIDAICAVSEFSAGVDEMPVVFGTTGLTGSWLFAKLLTSKSQAVARMVQCAFWLSANPPQGAAAGRHPSLPPGFDHLP
jgi:hypothetical protein